MIVSERSNFPTDLYIAEALSPRSAATSCELVDADELAGGARPTTSRC